LPVKVQGELAAVLVAGTTQPAGARLLADQLPALQELAAVAGALLSGELSDRLRNGKLRARIEAIIRDEAFAVAFQPVVDLASSTVVGFEALTRFEDGTPPDVAFADAETAGLGIELEEATLRAAAKASSRLPRGAWLSMNVSPAMLAANGHLRTAIAAAERSLVLEITERTPIDDYLAVRSAITELGDGIRMAVDDAGAGFASLRHIVELMPQFVKLDMGLVRGVDRDPARQALVAGMVYYAAEIGCALVAEGIETEAERRALRRLGVSFGQGFLLGRPSPDGA
jgi:EAL domain-containing protein (putative c-di-GMP-specific phosphodiesterase class I)